MKKFFIFLIIVLLAGGVVLLLPLGEITQKKQSKKNAPIEEFKLGVVTDEKLIITGELTHIWKSYNRLIFEPLFETVNGERSPLLASSWTEGDVEYTFELRDGINFSSGRELSPEDVMASYEYFKENLLLPKEFTDNITKVEADGNKVKFIVVKKSSEFLDGLEALLIFSKESKTKDEEFLGTGPYTAKDENLKARDDYWAAAPQAKNIILSKFAKDKIDEAQDKLSNGELTGVFAEAADEFAPYIKAVVPYSDGIYLYWKDETIKFDTAKHWTLADLQKETTEEQEETSKVPLWKKLASYGIIKGLWPT